MQGGKQHPVGVGELALELLVDLQNDLVQRLLGVMAESTCLLYTSMLLPLYPGLFRI